MVGPTFSDDDPEQTGESAIYDRDVTGGTAVAVTNGRIDYDFPEANGPGIKVVPGPVDVGGNDLAGCIMASSGSTCDGPRQSGKRFKQKITGLGPTDLVFDTNPDGTIGEITDANGNTLDGDIGYRVFHKLTNETGAPLAGFKLSLGTGVGGDFTASGSGDGLSFSQDFENGPEKLNAYAQFPAGLFGEPSDRNGDLGGFFDRVERSGFKTVFGADMIETAGFFGSYGDTFGPWFTGEAVPTGLFWDDGNDDVEDPLIAWILDDGRVEQRRDVENGVVSNLAEDAFALFANLEEFKTTEADLFADLFSGAIEDLANVNMNFAIDLTGFAGESFTLRVTPTPVPLPATAPLLLVGIGAIAMIRRRKRTKAI
ncbi:VPLPA-CTERM sorting domain-containing protein [Roseovarius tolerans]|uniref:VPLPA-CTERM sorting domain-containing protein n=1 Tax=Roseovarius tolerans TaxID=74031 RepID=UPI000942CB4B|nr:choice-of-anchor F family protein [Roseovarius tolerans]